MQLHSPPSKHWPTLTDFGQCNWPKHKLLWTSLNRLLQSTIALLYMCCSTTVYKEAACERSVMCTTKLLQGRITGKIIIYSKVKRISFKNQIKYKTFF